MDDGLLVCESVTAALAGEIVVAAVERIKVDTTQALRAAVAELCRPLGAAVARGHVLVERAETASLDLFTSLAFQVLVSAVLRIVPFEGGWVVCRALMSCRSNMRGRIVRTSVMLGMGARVALGLRL